MECNTENAINNAFYHENTTKHYETQYNKPLNLYELIRNGIKDDNYHYINYLIFKRLNYLENTVNKHTKKHGIKIDFNYFNDANVFFIYTEEHYCNLLNSYTRSFAGYSAYGIDIENLIKETIKYKDWDMLISIYFREKMELLEFIAKEDRKI